MISRPLCLPLGPCCCISVSLCLFLSLFRALSHSLCLSLSLCRCFEVLPKLTPEVMAKIDEAIGTKPTRNPAYGMGVKAHL